MRGVQPAEPAGHRRLVPTSLRLITSEPVAGTPSSAGVQPDREPAAAEGDAPALVWVQFPDGSPDELAERTGPNVARIVSVGRCAPATRVGDLVAIDDVADPDRPGYHPYRSTLASGGYVAYRFAGDHPGERNWSVLLRQLTNREWIVWPVEPTSPRQRGSEELVVHLAVPAYVEPYEVAAVLHALTGDWARPPQWPALAALAARADADTPDPGVA